MNSREEDTNRKRNQGEQEDSELKPGRINNFALSQPKETYQTLFTRGTSHVFLHVYASTTKLLFSKKIKGMWNDL